MGRDTIAEIITSIRNADMDRKRVVRVASTNITENIVKILFREGFIENVRKHKEKTKYFLVLTYGGIGIETKSVMKKEQKYIYEGLITESLPNGKNPM
ncbi:40S ribosomal protein [Orobanche gracilis]